ncbi:MAG: DUF4150 domain-containing protein [Methyloglobulus sp.]|nr:DUF4150 domain-containing protein [Methyloglobulus sp.]
MSNEVYANGDEIACKSGDGKVIASFPDVCLSPPSPPAGPIPVPYPNTSFSKDAQNGSKTVVISGKEVMLKDQSFYKTSPLGDEAATRSFGANILSHVITGKTYFIAWSMDVKIEDMNVDRHIDFTTSNHASHPAGVSVPNPNLDAMTMAQLENEQNQCACCSEPRHSTGRQMTMAGWYGFNEKGTDGKLTGDAKTKRKKYREMVRAKDARGCSCRVFPESPCNVFRETTQAERDLINTKYEALKNTRGYRELILGVPAMAVVNASAAAAGLIPGTVPHAQHVQERRQVNHLTPRSAGGCPIGDQNLAPHDSLCAGCKDIETQFTSWQSSRPLKP